MKKFLFLLIFFACLIAFEDKWKPYADEQVEWLKQQPVYIQTTERLSKTTSTTPETATAPVKVISTDPIGKSEEQITNEFGSVQRKTINEYGGQWLTFHQNYEQFLMVFVNDAKIVQGYYTNSPSYSFTETVHIQQTTKNEIESMYGQPLEDVKKGHVIYKLANDSSYGTHLLGERYYTFYYDQFNNYKVRAIFMIEKNTEDDKASFYGIPSDELAISFQWQLFDLTNASRVEHNLPALKWDDQIANTALHHSEDMATKAYFSHTNLEGKSPFDRMVDDGISYHVAGENLAYGQMNSIFAHEGLMNSEGHRENILSPDYANLGIGIAFNKSSQPYFTENFYTK